MKRKLREGDKVLVVAGNDKGKTGNILFFRGKDKVVVQGINVRKKNVKKSQENPQGGQLELELPLHISNVQVCDADDKPVKLKARFSKDGEKEFYYNKDGKQHLHRSVIKSKQ